MALSYRRDPALHYVTNGSALPFPMAAGTIAAHIRHGDKHVEMKLVPAPRSAWPCTHNGLGKLAYSTRI
jgi:hypothetical protein